MSVGGGHCRGDAGGYLLCEPLEMGGGRGVNVGGVVVVVVVVVIVARCPLYRWRAEVNIEIWRFGDL